MGLVGVHRRQAPGTLPPGVYLGDVEQEAEVMLTPEEIAAKQVAASLMQTHAEQIGQSVSMIGASSTSMVLSFLAEMISEMDTPRHKLH